MRPFRVWKNLCVHELGLHKNCNLFFMEYRLCKRSKDILLFCGDIIRGVPSDVYGNLKEDPRFDTLGDQGESLGFPVCSQSYLPAWCKEVWRIITFQQLRLKESSLLV
jgi:hypothetical protein